MYFSAILRKNRTLSLLCLFPLLLILFSCGSNRHVYPNKGEDYSAASSAERGDVSSRAAVIRAPKNLPEKLQDYLNHPFSIPESEMSLILQSLFYAEWDRMGIFGKPKPIFSRDSVDQLAREMSTAFSQANRDQVIRFQVQKEKAQTTGYALVAGDTMYWNFDRINGLAFDYKDIFDESWGRKDENPPPNWKLVEKKGQKLFTYTGILSKYGLENFLMVSLKYFSVAGAGEAGRDTTKAKTGLSQKRTQIPEKGTVLERYEELKKLKKEKIVTGPEYEGKARTLMGEERNLTAPEEIKLLNYFRMDGFITEDEYKEKKKKLLEKL